MAKMYLDKDNRAVIKHSHGVYMIVDVKAGKNLGWWQGSPRAEKFKLVGDVPDGIAGGAKTDIAPEKLLVIAAAVNKLTVPLG